MNGVAMDVLARDYPGYEFSSVMLYRGLAVMARRRTGVRAEGLYVLITDDMNEMRRELDSGNPRQ